MEYSHSPLIGHPYGAKWPKNDTSTPSCDGYGRSLFFVLPPCSTFSGHEFHPLTPHRLARHFLRLGLVC